MNKYNETFGIDISKDVFDCYGSKQGHLQFKNTEEGFKKFYKTLSKNSLVVMEATGYYHYRFAQFLYKKCVEVSVVNPLSIKPTFLVSFTLALAEPLEAPKFTIAP